MGRVVMIFVLGFVARGQEAIGCHAARGLRLILSTHKKSFYLLPCSLPSPCCHCGNTMCTRSRTSLIIIGTVLVVSQVPLVTDVASKLVEWDEPKPGWRKELTRSLAVWLRLRLVSTVSLSNPLGVPSSPFADSENEIPSGNWDSVRQTFSLSKN